MMALVIGGSGSGKSAYAEQLVCTLAKEEHTPKYYLATMRILDGEGWRKAERHRALRRHKGFVTIEQPTDIACALEQAKAGGCTALLECLSNLTANEMFSDEGMRTETEVMEKVLRDVLRLYENVKHLVIVSSNVFEDGISYDQTTLAYMRALGGVHRQLAKKADRVVEAVAGNPYLIKPYAGEKEQICGQ